MDILPPLIMSFRGCRRIRRVCRLPLYALFVFVLTMAVCKSESVGAAGVEVRELSTGKYKILPEKNRTELEQFAQWFHQDWPLLFNNVHDGAMIYFSTLPPERKRILREELLDFVRTNSDYSQSEVKKYWLNLGAQGWQPDLEIIATLREFADILQRS